MKRWIAVVVLAALALGQVLPASAQTRLYSQAELEALLAPVALYPDPVLSHILIAATFPDEVREAAAWSRANSHLAGENAVRAAESMGWHPSVKALLAFPELVQRMDESPRWVVDLGAAFTDQEPQLMDAVQALRRRAQASGHLQSNTQQQVYDQGGALAVYPAHPQVVYLAWYDPFAVYGPLPWHYRPVSWRPWHAYPTAFAFSHVFVVRSVDWHRRHVVRHHAQPRWQQRRPVAHPPVTVHNHVHQPRPIVDSVRLPAQQDARRSGHHAQPPRQAPAARHGPRVYPSRG